MSNESFEEYRQRVLGYLGDRDPIQVQQSTPELLEKILNELDHQRIIRRHAPEKWSIAEIVGHLADAELAMGWRLRNMLATPGIKLTWWDEGLWAENLFYIRRDVGCALALFRALREGNLELLKAFTPQQWEESYGVHDVRGKQSVTDFIRMEAAHDLNHLRQIEHILGENYS